MHKLWERREIFLFVFCFKFSQFFNEKKNKSLIFISSKNCENHAYICVYSYFIIWSTSAKRVDFLVRCFYEFLFSFIVLNQISVIFETNHWPVNSTSRIYVYKPFIRAIPCETLKLSLSLNNIITKTENKTSQSTFSSRFTWLFQMDIRCIFFMWFA